MPPQITPSWKPRWLEEHGGGCGGYSSPLIRAAAPELGRGTGAGPVGTPTPLALTTCQETRREGEGAL